MEDEETVVAKSGADFSEAQLGAIAGVVQRLLDKALSERGSGPSRDGAGSEATAEPQATEKSSTTVPSEFSRLT